MKKILILFLFSAIPLFSQNADNMSIFVKINELRSSKSLDSLHYNKRLQGCAKGWSKYILKKLHKFSDDEIRQNHKKDPDFLHVDFNPRFDKALKIKEMMSIGENINLTVEDDFEGVDFVSFAFKCWLNSKSHYELMTDSTSNTFAFDYTYDKKTKRLLCLLVIAKIEK